MYNYRIYLYREFGYEYETTTSKKVDIDLYINKPTKDYSKLLVIRHHIKLDMDEVYLLKYFDVKVRKRKK